MFLLLGYLFDSRFLVSNVVTDVGSLCVVLTPNRIEILATFSLLEDEFVHPVTKIRKDTKIEILNRLCFIYANAIKEGYSVSKDQILLSHKGVDELLITLRIVAKVVLNVE
jgi:hypothetical protein